MSLLLQKTYEFLINKYKIKISGLFVKTIKFNTKMGSLIFYVWKQVRSWGGCDRCGHTRLNKIVPFIFVHKKKARKKLKSIFNVYIIKQLLYYAIFESVSISNYQLTRILFIHWILCRQDIVRIQFFFFLSFFCIDKEAMSTSKSLCFIENRCGTWIIHATLIIICIIQC